MTVALVHDYLTQRGGAERVVLALTRAFPERPSTRRSTTLAGTFPEFQLTLTSGRCRSTGSRRCGRTIAPPCRSSPRRSRTCGSPPTSSSAARAAGHTERRSRAGRSSTATRRRAGSTSPIAISAAGVARYALVPVCSSRALERWDKKAAASADAYLANSTVVAERIRSIYGIDAEVVPPPPAITPDGPSQADQRSRTRLPALRLPPPALQERRRRGRSGLGTPRASDSSSPAAARWSSALRLRATLERHVRGQRHGLSTPLAVRELPSAHRGLVRRLRTDTARSRELRQTDCGSSLGRLPGHDRGGTHWGLFRRAHNACDHRARSTTFARPNGDEKQFRRLRRVSRRNASSSMSSLPHKAETPLTASLGSSNPPSSR